MKLRVLPYVTVEVDDRLRHRLRRAGERWRLNMRAYLLSAADDVDSAVEGAGDRVRGLCDRAVNRIDSVAATVTDTSAGRLISGPVRSESGSWWTLIAPGTTAAITSALNAVMATVGLADWSATPRTGR